MTKAVDILKIRQARGRLLTNLNLFYPTPVQMATLYRTVCDDPDYCAALYRKDIQYFRDKGYIRCIDDALGGMPEWEKKVIVLTAAGKEVAEGTVIDPALEI